MDYRLALMTGIDIPIPECQLVIHQPSIKEISFIGEKTFFPGIQCLCLYKSAFIEDKTHLSDINNFQIFMMIMQESGAKDKKEAVKQVLTLLFPTKKVLITPTSLLFTEKDQENILIDENNFELLQEVIRKIVCMQNAPMDQQAFNPHGDKAKEIAQKLMRGRERIAKEQGNTNISVFTQYISTLSIALHLSLQSLIDLTIFQLYDLIERYSLWANWDLDVKTRLAGGKPDNKPDNWMKNIHNF